MAMTFQANERLMIELEAQQWDQVLKLVAAGRFMDVAGLVQEIQNQLAKQAKPSNVFPMEAQSND